MEEKKWVIQGGHLNKHQLKDKNHDQGHGGRTEVQTDSTTQTMAPASPRDEDLSTWCLLRDSHQSGAELLWWVQARSNDSSSPFFVPLSPQNLS